MYVLKKILLGTFVGSNQLYTLWRSFSESFKKTSFWFITLLMPSTCPQQHIDEKNGHSRTCSWCLSVLLEIFLWAVVSSNQLLDLRRSFPESAKKLSFLKTLMKHSTRPHLSSQRSENANVQAIFKVKNKSVNCLKHSENDLLSSKSWLELTTAERKISNNTDRHHEHVQEWPFFSSICCWGYHVEGIRKVINQNKALSYIFAISQRANSYPS